MTPSILPDDRAGFRVLSRHITAHDGKGISKFIPDHIISSKAPWQDIGPDVVQHLLWGTTRSPVQMTDDADVKAYTSGVIKTSDIVTPNGTNIRLLDFAPGFESAMHRTYSIDYGVVIHGTIESHMDGGEVRRGKPEDIFIQRRTNHRLRNPSKTDWTRMFFVVVAAAPLVVEGKRLEAAKSDHSSVVKK
jgi:quercetin dioxygenase-like cupin family protein